MSLETQRERARQPTRLQVTSAAFHDGDPIPVRYTADGEGASPPLAWSEPPAATRSFVILCEDPDAPSGLFVHWLAWGIHADRRGVDEGIAPTAETSSIVQGQNGFRRVGYGGPKPPPGKPHHYVFRVLALDHRPALGDGASRAELDRAMQGHVLAQGTLVGTYGR